VGELKAVFCYEVYADASHKDVDNCGDNKGGIKGEEKKNEVWWIEEGRLGVGEERGSRKEDIIPERKCAIG